MKSRPILFSAPMVRAILDGRKTQTRRVVRELPGGRGGLVGDHVKWFERGQQDATRWCGHDGLGSLGWVTCPYGEPGDQLWCKETWGLHAHGDETDWLRGSVRGIPEGSLSTQYSLALRADWGPLQEGCFWRPAIFMPRWASRITLEVTEVRVQRLQEISGEDAVAEGISAPRCGCEVCRMSSAMCPADASAHVEEFADLWDSINGKARPTLDDDGDPVLDDNDRPIMVASRSWSSNPYVWAISFRRMP